MPRTLPLWAIGLANAPLGFYYGFLNTSMPLLLTRQGVPLPMIATISAIAFSPTFWVFLLAPSLDLGLTRQAWSILWAVVAALCIVGSVFATAHLVLFTVIVTSGCAAIALFGSSLGGWLPEIVPEEQRAWVGAWFQVANLGAAALFGISAVLLVEHLAAPLAGALLALALLMPLSLLAFFPAPAAPARSAVVVFRNLFRDLAAIVRQREVLLALLAFLTPASCFALTNLFAGLGPDFHASERSVQLVCGAGVAIACSAGCLLGGSLADRFSRMHLYVLTGLAGAGVAGATLLAPRSAVTFAAATLAYNFLQGINYTAYAALCFRLVGRGNPLAATQFSVLFCATCLPISYMTWIDGRGYAARGLSGLFATDAGASFLFGAALLLVISLAGSARQLPSDATDRWPGSS